MSETDPQQDKEKPTFEDFKEVFSQNPKLTNMDLYDKFEPIPKSTVRTWKKRVLDNIKPPQNPKTDNETANKNEEFLKQSVDTLKKLVKVDPGLLVGLDLQGQFTVLQNAAQEKPPDPNMKLYTPASTGKEALGLEEYITIDEKAFKTKGFGDVEIIIPASKLFDPEENKKLREYKK